jgi:hypothetical protein
MTIDETAVEYRRPRGTVAKQHDRATKKLRALALDSERATLLGARRPTAE